VESVSWRRTQGSVPCLPIVARLIMFSGVDFSAGITLNFGRSDSEF
jgi:hypothetical protein